MSSILLKISGRVQGVCFRSETKKKADALGITGWVKNCDDGSVEVCAEGTDESLKIFEEWCNEGPSTARIDEVIKKNGDTQQYNNFTIAS